MHQPPSDLQPDPAGHRVQARLTLALGGAAGLNILLGFVFQWIVVTTLGAGRSTDALAAGMLLPQLLLAVVGASLAHVLVPLFAAADEEERHRDAWTLFAGVGLVFLGAALILGPSAGLWIPLLLPGFDQEAVTLSVSLTRINLVGLVLAGPSVVLSSLNHTRRRFLRVEVATTLASVAAIAFVVVYLESSGARAAAWGFTVRVTIQTLLLAGALGAPPAHWRRPVLVDAWRRIRPLLLGSSFHKTDFIVDRYLASMAPPGGMTLLALAQQIYAAGYSVIDKALCAPASPILARAASAARWDEFRQTYTARLRFALAVALPCYLLLVLVGEPLLRLLIGYGHISEANVHTLWVLLLCSGGVWILAPIGRIMSMAFYSVGNTRTPATLGAVAFAASIVLRVSLFAAFGLPGLAAAMTLHYLTAFTLMLIATRVHGVLRGPALLASGD